MGMRYVIEVVADTPDQMVEAEHLLMRLPEAGVFTSALSVTDTGTGCADDTEKRWPLNVALVTRYAQARGQS